MERDTHRILVVDDEPDICKALEFILRRKGYVVSTASDGESALSLLGKESFDLMLTDIRMEGMDGLELTRRAKELNSELLVIIMTAFASIQSAVEAMKLGASDYIVKPFVNDDVLNTIQLLVEHQRVILENKSLRYRLGQEMEGKDFLGDSPALKNVLQQLEKIIPTNGNILLLGESGTGKSLIAEHIHNQGPRRGRPFMSINCSAIPENLLESELFGYKKGAFTGADKDKAGLIRIADRGTLFLDEIGDMPLSLQAKILKVFETGELMALGDTRTTKVDVRVITATNRNLEELIAKKQFREDLYYRLSVFEIRLPALRERVNDIEMLAKHFAAFFSRQHHKLVEGLTPEALQIIKNYSWPGNVRELRNIIERAVVLCDGNTITGPCLPGKLRIEKPQRGKGLKDMISAFEREVILDSLAMHGGNKEKAASHLEIDLATLYRKMKKLDVNA